MSPSNRHQGIVALGDPQRSRHRRPRSRAGRHLAGRPRRWTRGRRSRSRCPLTASSLGGRVGVDRDEEIAAGVVRQRGARLERNEGVVLACQDHLEARRCAAAPRDVTGRHVEHQLFSASPARARAPRGLRHHGPHRARRRRSDPVSRRSSAAPERCWRRRFQRERERRSRKRPAQARPRRASHALATRGGRLRLEGLTPMVRDPIPRLHGDCSDPHAESVGETRSRDALPASPAAHAQTRHAAASVDSLAASAGRAPASGTFDGARTVNSAVSLKTLRGTQSGTARTCEACRASWRRWDRSPMDRCWSLEPQGDHVVLTVSRVGTTMAR